MPRPTRSRSLSHAGDETPRQVPFATEAVGTATGPTSRRDAVRLGAVALGGLATAFQPRGVAAESKRDSKKVAVTIDDGPASGTGRDFDAFHAITTQLNETFVQEKVPAIMFINERQLHVRGQRDARTELVRQWLESGLELGNHTYSHKRLSKVSDVEFKDDVIHGEVISRDLLAEQGETLKWFRYPYLSSERGERAERIEAFLKAREYRIAPVTVDYKDYTYASTYSRRKRAGDSAGINEIRDAVVKHCRDAFKRAEATSEQLLGRQLPQVLLVHCNELNADHLKESLAAMRDAGYQFVSLDEAMKDPAYSTPNLPAGSLGGWFFSGLESVT